MHRVATEIKNLWTYILDGLEMMQVYGIVCNFSSQSILYLVEQFS